MWGVQERKIKIIDELNHADNFKEVTADSVKRSINKSKLKLATAQREFLTKNSPDFQLYLERTQKMLRFAQDNFDKGFFNTAAYCVKLDENYLDRCRD